MSKMSPISRRDLCAVCVAVMSFSVFLGANNSYGASPTSGLDTPVNVTSMPFAIGGNEVMVLVPGGITFPGVTGMLDATAVQTLINLAKTPACTDGTALSKTGATTFSCVAPSAPVTTAADTSSSSASNSSSSSSIAPGTAIGGGNCTPYVCGGSTTCGGTPQCPSSWTFWGVGQSGGCSSGSSSYGGNGTSFTCVAN